MNTLTVRQELQPHSMCGQIGHRLNGKDQIETHCWRKPEFAFDAPGEVCENLCHYHARKRVLDLIDQMHAEALRDYDQQTTRLQLAGKPCKICGKRRERHYDLDYVEQTAVAQVSLDHEWTDDEDTAEAFDQEKADQRSHYDKKHPQLEKPCRICGTSQEYHLKPPLRGGFPYAHEWTERDKEERK